MPITTLIYVSAVREDRMPGGRNSGAVYNMYKVINLLFLILHFHKMLHLTYTFHNSSFVPKTN